MIRNFLLGMMLFLVSVPLLAQQTQETKLPVRQITDLGDGNIMVGTASANQTLALTAANIPATTITGVTGDDVQEILENMKALIDSGGDGWGVDTVVSNTTLIGQGTNASDLEVNTAVIAERTYAQSFAQTLSKDGNTVTLTQGDGLGGGSFTDAVDDADANATNELQNITRTGNSITLDQGGGSQDVTDDVTTETFLVSSTSSTLTLSATIDGTYPDQIWVTRNGFNQTVATSGSATDMTASGTTLTANYADFENGDVIVVRFIAQ